MLSYLRVKSNDNDASWLGTFTDTKTQNERVVKASMRRQSIIEIQCFHARELRAMQDEFPGAPTHDLIRFLEARNYNVTKAIDMYAAHLEWKRQTLPIPREEVEETLATRKYYMLDELDKDRHPVIVFRLQGFNEVPFTIEDEIKAIVYMFEHEVKPRFGPSFDQQKVTVLVQIAAGGGKPPLGFFQEANKVMEANYPELLFRAILVPVPYLWQKIINGILSFISEDTRSKIAFANDVKALEQFAQMPIEQMGPDIQGMVASKQLKQ